MPTLEDLWNESEVADVGSGLDAAGAPLPGTAPEIVGPFTPRATPSGGKPVTLRDLWDETPAPRAATDAEIDFVLRGNAGHQPRGDEGAGAAALLAGGLTPAHGAAPALVAPSPGPDPVSRPGALGVLSDTARDIAGVPLSLVRIAAAQPMVLQTADEIRQREKLRRETGSTGSWLADIRNRIKDLQAPGGPLGPSAEQMDPLGARGVAHNIIAGGAPSAVLTVAGARASRGRGGAAQKVAAGAGAGLQATEAFVDRYEENILRGVPDNAALADAVIVGGANFGWEFAGNILEIKALDGVLSPKALGQLRRYKEARAKDLLAGTSVAEGIAKELGSFGDWFKRNLTAKMGRVFNLTVPEAAEEVATEATERLSSKITGAPRQDNPYLAVGLAGAGGGGMIGAINAPMQARLTSRMRATIADPTVPAADRLAAVNTVADDLKARGLKSEAAILRADWTHRVGKGLPIDLEQRGVDATDPRAQLSSPEALARTSGELRERAAAARTAPPAAPTGAAPASNKPADLLSFLQDQLEQTGVAPETVSLVPKDALNAEQRAVQDAYKERGFGVVFFAVSDGRPAAAVSGGPTTFFLPASLAKRDLLFKAAHEAGHGLDDRPGIAGATAATRDTIARIIPEEEYARRAYGLEIDRAAAGLAPASAAVEFDEMVQDLRGKAGEAAGLNPKQTVAKVLAWARGVAEAEPTRWERLKDELRTRAASIVPGIGLPDPRRGTAAQWGLVANAILAENAAASEQAKNAERARLVNVLNQMPGAQEGAERLAGGGGRRDVTQDQQGVQAKDVVTEGAPPSPPPPSPAMPRPVKTKPRERLELENRAVALGVQNPVILTDQELRDEIVQAIANRKRNPLIKRRTSPPAATAAPAATAGPTTATGSEGPASTAAPAATEPFTVRGREFTPGETVVDKRGLSLVVIGPGSTADTVMVRSGATGREILASNLADAPRAPAPEPAAAPGPANPHTVQDLEADPEATAELGRREGEKRRLFGKGKASPISGAVFNVGEVVRHVSGDLVRVVQSEGPGYVRVVPVGQGDKALSMRAPTEALTRVTAAEASPPPAKASLAPAEAAPASRRPFLPKSRPEPPAAPELAVGTALYETDRKLANGTYLEVIDRRTVDQKFAPGGVVVREWQAGREGKLRRIPTKDAQAMGSMSGEELSRHWARLEAQDADREAKGGGELSSIQAAIRGNGGIRSGGYSARQARAEQLKDRQPQYGVFRKNGLHADKMAQVLGYEETEDMWDALERELATGRPSHMARRDAAFSLPKTGEQPNLLDTQAQLPGGKVQPKVQQRTAADLPLFDKQKADEQGSLFSLPAFTREEIKGASRAVLSRMNARLKAKGYDVRGADDVRELALRQAGATPTEDWVDAWNFARGSVDAQKGRRLDRAEKFPDVNWSRLARLGLTGDLREAGYIRPDGKLIDLSGKREGGQPGTRALDHREAGGTEGMLQAMRAGYIRMDANAGAVDLAAAATPAQESVIRRLSAMHDGELVIDLWDGDRRWSKEYPKGTPADRIVNDARKFFSGEQPYESTIRDFHGRFSLPTLERHVADLREQEAAASGPRRAMIVERRVAAERELREARLRARAPGEFGGDEARYSLAGDAERNREQAFRDSKVRDEKGELLVVYHGGKRPDRIGTIFREDRATSGPMPFFTEAPEVASRYANGKADTSLEAPEDYAGWFKFKPPGRRSTVDVDRAWYFLNRDQRQILAERLPHVTEYDYANNKEHRGEFVVDMDHFSPAGRQSWEWQLQQERGNVLKAAKEFWLNGGLLVDREEEFLDVLRATGVEGVEIQFDSPYRENPAVFPVHLNITRPFDTQADVTPEVVADLERLSRRQRRPRLLRNADTWDKQNRDPREWVNQLKEDHASGTNSFVWTSIPDWVTDYLKSKGYDGIHDKGGKLGTEEHGVWIPFYRWQVKSATGNVGTYGQRPPTREEARPLGMTAKQAAAAQAKGDIRFSLPATHDPEGAERIRGAWAERGLSLARGVEHAVKYWPAGGQPGEDLLGRIPAGREYLQKVERAWWEAKRRAAAWLSPLNDARRGLTRADRRYIRDNFMRAYEEGGADQAWPSPALAAFAQAWRDTNETIASEAGEIIEQFAGRDPDTYVPHRLTDAGRAILQRQAGPEWDALVEAAQVNGIDLAVLRGLSQDPLRQSRYGSIDYARIANLPWEITTAEGRTVALLETDPDVLFRHVRAAARRLSTIEEFGTDEDSEAFHQSVAAGLIADGRLDTEAAARTQEVLQRIWKRLQGQDSVEIKTRWRRALWQSLDSVTAALTLSGAVIGNLVGGPLPQMIRMGGAETLKDFYDAYTTAIKSDDLATIRGLVDLEGDLLAALATTETLEGRVARGAGKFLGATGFIAVNRKINQAVATAMISRQLQLMVDRIAAGKTSGKAWGLDAAAARRYLVDELKFSDEETVDKKTGQVIPGDIERMIAEGVTDADKARAAGKQLELVNAMNEAPGGRPANIAHPLWRLAFAYSTYARKMYDTTKFVAREGRAGNYRPLATMLFAGAITAELIGAIKDFLKDRDKEEKGYLDKLLSSLAEIGALGLAGSWRYGIMRMNDPKADLWSDLTKPPHVEVVTAFIEGIGKSATQASLKPFWKSITGVASGLDILDKQLTRRGFLPSPKTIADEETGAEVTATRRQREYADRLVGQVYMRDSTRAGVQRKALDPIPSKFRPATTRRLIADLRADGLGDEQILTLIEDARRRREGER